MAECPSVAELIEKAKSLTRETNGIFQDAWSDSFIDSSHCCEQGGFIYVGMRLASYHTELPNQPAQTTPYRPG